jgi:regulator of protease activity HflC (stomatin/prohibitin superfamily)
MRGSTMKRKLLGVLLLFVAVALLGACSERVPPGYVGMVMTPNGLTGTVLQPGNHTCYNRDRMALIEMVEVEITEKMEVLCDDDLNMKFDLKVRSRLKIADAKGVLAVLNRQGSKIRWDGSRGVLSYENLYNTYIKGPARSITRGVVSKYKTTSIRGARKSIEKAIAEELNEAIKGTPVEITMVVTSNLDYPDVITTAMEAKRTREIKIGQEKAQQAIELLKAENRLKIAQKMKITRAAEAEAEGIYNTVMAKSLTEKYLKLREIEAKLELYKNIKDKDKIIITEGVGVTPLINVDPK